MEQPNDVRAKLLDTLKKLDTVMVATRAQNGTLRARPMAIAEVDAHGDVWFATSKETPKTDEAERDPRGLITAQDGMLYLSVSGTLDVVDDRAKVQKLWKESWRVYFPNGRDDPSIVLLRLRPDVGEYWDNTGAKGLRFLWEAAAAVLKGERPQTDAPDQHAKVSM